MRISCPYCGTRDAKEFSILGDAAPRRPEASAIDDWVDFTYFRSNPAGILRELWYHARACRALLVVERDTRTHEIFLVELAATSARQRSYGA